MKVTIQDAQERMGLMAYFISLRQMGHWERARAQEEQVTMWAQGRNTMSISASMHTLHMWESLIFSSSAARSWDVCGFPEMESLSLSESGLFNAFFTSGEGEEDGPGVELEG